MSKRKMGGLDSPVVAHDTLPKRLSSKLAIPRSGSSQLLLNNNEVDQNAGYKFKTKIVCTLGPSSRDLDTLKKMLRHGMNVARFNFSHGSHEVCQFSPRFRF